MRDYNGITLLLKIEQTNSTHYYMVVYIAVENYVMMASVNHLLTGQFD